MLVGSALKCKPPNARSGIYSSYLKRKSRCENPALARGPDRLDRTGSCRLHVAIVHRRNHWPCHRGPHEPPRETGAVQNCASLFLTMNTPGGDLESTHEVVEKILNFPVPVLCLVAPAGAHAGSAGAIILQACHVNGGMRGTNIGAATPIEESGQDIPKDLRRKILNDTQSWLQSVVKLRGRNLKFAQDIILEAKSVTAEEAKRLNAIDIVVESTSGFLVFANHWPVDLAEGKHVSVEVGPVKKMELDAQFPGFRNPHRPPNRLHSVSCQSCANLLRIHTPGVLSPAFRARLDWLFL